MTTETTTPHPPGADLHLGGDAWAHPSLEPRLIPIEDAIPYPGNPRRGDQDAITASIRDLGLYTGVVLQRSTGHILVGNHRRHALIALGAAQIPVDYLDVDDTRAAAIVARDNRTSDLGGYDDGDLLALLTADDDVLALSGYDDDDLAVIRRSLDPAVYTPPIDTPSLADRFVVPPFTVLDQRAGAWQERKRRWLSLGIQSEVGRGSTAAEGISGVGPTGERWRENPDQYRQQAGKKRSLGAVQTNLDGEDAERHGRPDTRARSYKGQESLDSIRQASSPHSSRRIAATSQRTLGQGLQAHRNPDTGELIYTETTSAGVSIFDPVLTELAYRWFCPPGGHVLDPFAGGSVRGIIAAALGRTYTGIELRPEQVAANQGQADTIVPLLCRTPTLTAAPDNTPDLTPLEQHAGTWVKRDDTYRRAGQRGGKVRSCWHLATTGGTPSGLVTASSRHSPQAMIVAHIAQALGVPCRLHMPSGDPTEEMEVCRAAGAEVIQHRPGYNTVIVKRAADDAAETGYRLIPFGMECPEAVEQTATQAASLRSLPADVTRIVIPVGSGMSLAGLLTGMAEHGIDLPVLGVVVGADPTKRLARYAPDGWENMVTLVDSDQPYEHAAPTTTLGDLDLDPIYEAKCLPYLQGGDLLWVVGNRAPATVTGHAHAPAPTWITGDSAQVLPGLDVAADFVFSCPPYADLEVYSDDPADLSNMPYDDFLAAYRTIIAASLDRLRPDRFAAFVVGEVRDRRGLYRGFVPDTIRAFTDAGAALYNEAILVTPVGSLPIRAGRQFSAGRKMGKTHQNVLVFCKGDPRAAADACGTVEVTMPEPSPDE